MAERKIKITEKMREAGRAVYEDLRETYPDYLLVEEVYRAMVAAIGEDRTDPENGMKAETRSAKHRRSKPA